MQKERKQRRTKQQIENDTLLAIYNFVCNNGFSNVHITTLIKELDIDPAAFYRRYKTVYEAYADLVVKSDYWINDSDLKIDLSSIDEKDFLQNLLVKLLDDLVDNPIMQKVLLWELNEDNEITRKTANMRDIVNSRLIVYYKQLLNDEQTNLMGVIAIIIAGIYYLILQRGLGTFCMIDFSSPDGQNTLRESIEALTNMIFGYSNQFKMIREMHQDGIAVEKISKYTGLEISKIEEIIDANA